MFYIFVYNKLGANMYNVSSNSAYINGTNGIYDGKINNPQVRYGRNAVYNYKSYIADFKLNPVKMPDMSGLIGLSKDKFESKMAQLDDCVRQLEEQKMPPVHFELTYSKVKDGSIDTQSLMGASFEELGKTSIKTKTLSKQLKNTFTPSIFKQILDNIKAFFNGKPTRRLEFHSSKVTAKALDLNNDGAIDIGEYATSILLVDKLSNGEIMGKENNKGMNASIAYATKRNYKNAKAEFQALYNQYNLKEAQEEFLKNPNNIEQL